ncbi:MULTISPECIES: LysR family transcriptional regulator [Pseudomonas chlororaphis group]|uniref:LysR family transcriptional regulator n=1 Tax=Pseudomonas protegens TaxID=380021 RepID=UPI00209A7502|nr:MULTISPECIES: LysR family transcriptional regulator [Pseudomonas chlororaphis group]MCO7612813.1 LysR family transcriptional regulator [Pseudomonas chlororaphis]MDP9528760.1 LysR family transcriptional regulator [Pseudomonas protegens]
MMRADLPGLTAFITIAEHRSFSAAARVLGVSSSALSHSLRNLEARLQMRLFNRTTRSVALTEAGQQLLNGVRPLMSDLAAVIEQVTSTRISPSGSIRISASESSIRPLIEHVVADFVERYPNIHIEFVVDSRLQDIVGDGFDAGIRLLDDVPRDMVAIRFGPDLRFAAVASPAYLARHPAPQEPQDLKHHRCIRFRFTSGGLFRWDFKHAEQSVSLDVPGPLTLDNINLMVAAALAGTGIAWVPQTTVAEYLAAGRLVQLLAPWSPSYSGLCLYYPANRHPPIALRLFAEAVRDWASQTRDDGDAQQG